MYWWVYLYSINITVCNPFWFPRSKSYVILILIMYIFQKKTSQYVHIYLFIYLLQEKKKQIKSAVKILRRVLPSLSPPISHGPGSTRVFFKLQSSLSPVLPPLLRQQNSRESFFSFNQKYQKSRLQIWNTLKKEQKVRKGF